MRTAADAWILVRGMSCLGAAGAALLGAYLSDPEPFGFAGRGLIAALVVAAVVGSANVVNDIRDGAADRVDKPHRPIPSGRVSPRAAYIFAVLCGLLALGAAATLGVSAAVIALGTLAVGWLYSYYLKDTVLLGNAAIALLDGYCVVYGAQYTGGVSGRAVVAAVFVALFCFAYLVLVTLRDHRADRAARIRTVSTVLGERRAVRIFQGISVVTVIALGVPGILGWSSSLYLVAILITAIAPTAAAAILAGRRATGRGVHTAILLMRLSWFPGLAALALVR